MTQISGLPDFHPLLHYAEIDSTNEEAKRRAAAGAPHGLVIWADRQSAGRGRQGRAWQSPEGNLYCSVLLRPERAAAEVALLSFAAALAVSEAIAAFLPSRMVPRCKWPNDVLVQGKKVAGILLESEAAGANVAWLVIGIGINIAQHPPDTETPATSLAALGAEAVSPGELLSTLYERLILWHEIWQSQGFAPLRTAWLERAEGLGHEIRVRHATLETRGRFVDLDASGALVLENPEGRRHISAGAVFPAA